MTPAALMLLLAHLKKGQVAKARENGNSQRSPPSVGR